MIPYGYGFMGTSTLQQQAIHLVFGTDEGMVREKASGIFAALTEGTNEFSHEILEAACGDWDRTSCCSSPPPNLTSAVPLTNSCSNPPPRRN